MSQQVNSYILNLSYKEDRHQDIEALEGKMHASSGDYIIRGVNGEIYPCKPDIFEKTYEPEPPKEEHDE